MIKLHNLLVVVDSGDDVMLASLTSCAFGVDVVSLVKEADKPEAVVAITIVKQYG